MIRDKKIGVALSGGGYRAAGFHLGTLKKLHDLGVLDNVDILSTISGGSITGAAYCLNNKSFLEFEEHMIATLSSKSVVGYVLKSWRFLLVAIPLTLLLVASLLLPLTIWASYSVFALLILIVLIVKYQFKILPLSKIIESAYNIFFFNDATLPQLCQCPEIAIGSTNLQTMRHFTFSSRKMEDSAYAYYKPPIYFNNENFPVARAVMASTCVPFAFTPISIGKEFYRDNKQYNEVDPKLVDGGIYDNQGIHKLTQDNSSYACQIVIVSDAGSKLPFQKAYNNTFTLLLRTVEAFMVRIKNFQMMQNIYTKNPKREVAYLSLGWDLEQCIEGFYRNMIGGTISESTLVAHELLPEWIQSPKDYYVQIITHLENKVLYTKINLNNLDSKKLQAIRGIGTNLTCIRESLLKDMIIHAGNLTEIQIRLYCPSLFVV